MHFRLGENADPSLAFTRRTHRPLRLDVSEEALSGSDDDVITKVSLQKRFALITVDQGFAQIIHYPPRKSPG